MKMTLGPAKVVRVAGTPEERRSDTHGGTQAQRAFASMCPSTQFTWVKPLEKKGDQLEVTSDPSDATDLGRRAVLGYKNRSWRLFFCPFSDDFPRHSTVYLSVVQLSVVSNTLHGRSAPNSLANPDGVCLLPMDPSMDSSWLGSN